MLPLDRSYFIRAVTIDIRGCTFEVDESFAPLFWQDLNDGVWERSTFEFLDRFVGPSDTVMDMGCWAGPLTFYLAAKGALVHAVDPDPIAFRALQKNLDLNPDLRPNICTYEMAVTPDDRSTSLYARKSFGESSTSIIPRARDTRSMESTRGISFSKWVSEANISALQFIKMDIEAGEFSLLPTMANTLQDLEYPTIHISMHYQQLKEAFFLEHFGSRPLSKLLLKVEEILPINLFKERLLQSVASLMPLIGKYRYVYHAPGKVLHRQDLTPDYLLKNNLDLLLTNIQW